MLFNFCDNIYTVWWTELYYISFSNFCVGGGICFMFCWYSISCLHPAFINSSLYDLIGYLNIFSFADNCDILILLILGAAWLQTGDGWILRWHKLFFGCLSGKDGMMSFPNSKWHLGNSSLFYCIQVKV